MAEKKQKSKVRTLTDMASESVVIRHNGSEVIVPTTRHETALLNMFTASMLRTTVMDALKKWKDEGVTPTPKELADLARAAKDIATFAMESVPVPEKEPEKKVDPADATPKTDDDDFKGLLTKPEDKPEGAIEIEAEEPKNEQRDPS